MKKTLLNLCMLLVLGLLITGCQEKEADKQPPTDPDKKDQVKATTTSGTTQSTCPIMDGNKIDEKIFADYGGKRVYFCCAGCDVKFKKDPVGIIKKMEDAGVTPAKTPPVDLCSKCGQIKGGELCCKAGAEKCASCGLAKGSPACCKEIDFSKGQAQICGGCGQIKGSDKCCKSGDAKCPGCGLDKGAPGCCKL